MPWPHATQYSAAIQAPAACFADPDLAAGQPVADQLFGLPLAYSGGNALVFKVVSPNGRAWAVKCFTRDAPDRRDRYKAISDHLSRNRKKFTVRFKYLAEGIRVNGA